MWHIKPSKIWSYKQFRSTNIVPEEGIPQPYLDEGCGNVHGDQDGAPAPPRSDLNQSTKHSEKSHPCAEKIGTVPSRAMGRRVLPCEERLRGRGRRGRRARSSTLPSSTTAPASGRWRGRRHQHRSRSLRAAAPPPPPPWEARQAESEPY